MLVGYIVGQFKFVKVDHFGHPLLARGRTVRVDVHASGHLRVRFSRHHPVRVLKFISAVISRHDVHQQNVLCLSVHPCASGLKRRKHAPVDIRGDNHMKRAHTLHCGNSFSCINETYLPPGFCNNHLCAAFVELSPKVAGFQINFGLIVCHLCAFLDLGRPTK